MGEMTCERCHLPIVWVDDRYWGVVGSHAGVCAREPVYTPYAEGGQLTRDMAHKPLVPDLTNRVELERWLE